MKIGTLFDLLTDARDVLEFFEGCDNREQLVSRLERLKRQGSEDLMECIDGLRVTLDATFNDTLEMSASLDDSEESDLNDALDNELEDLVGKLESQTLESQTLESQTLESQTLEKDLPDVDAVQVPKPDANDQKTEQKLPVVDLKSDTTTSA